MTKPSVDFDAMIRNLPPVREGNERAFKLWPGGRSEFPQVRPERIQTVDEAMATLSNGGFAIVKVSDARELVEQWVKGGIMRCHKCGNAAFLIRCLCAACAPDLHEQHNKRLQFIDNANTAFKEATGKDSLGAWDEFEKFMEANLAKEFLEVFS